MAHDSTEQRVTAGLLEEQVDDFNEFIARVVTESGITAKGMPAIKEEGPGVFDVVVAPAPGEKDDVGEHDKTHPSHYNR